MKTMTLLSDEFYHVVKFEQLNMVSLLCLNLKTYSLRRRGAHGEAILEREIPD